MSYFLRKISLNKWQPNLERVIEDFTADAITGCTRTSRNTLSVWASETTNFEADEVVRLITAMATTMDKPDVIDLVWLDSQWLSQNDIEIVATLGGSKIETINPLHRDLSGLNHKKLGVVASHIVSQLKNQANYKRIPRPTVIQYVVKAALEFNLLNREELSDNWLKHFPQ